MGWIAAIIFCTVAVKMGCDNAGNISQEETASDEVHQVADELPKLVGGLRALNVKYPDIARKAGIEGKVYVKVVVDEEGNVADATVVKGVGAGLDEEALRAVRAVTFEPGRQNRKAVTVQMTLPIVFKMREEAGTTTPDQLLPPNLSPGIEDVTVVVKGSVSIQETASQGVFLIVDEMPRLIGGLQSLADRIRYPDIARKAGVEGKVFVQLVVDEEGNVTDAAVKRGVGAGLDEEALRVVRLSKFEPGLQHGNPVKVRLTIPIDFRLN